MNASPFPVAMNLHIYSCVETGEKPGINRGSEGAAGPAPGSGCAQVSAFRRQPSAGPEHWSKGQGDLISPGRELTGEEAVGKGGRL